MSGLLPLNTLNNYGEITVTINNNNNTNKHSRESDSESDSSISSCEVKRRKKISYFLGRGEKIWVPKQELLVNNINITKALKKFRKASVKEAEKEGGLNSLRILSLSNIFPINKLEKNKCITEYLTRNQSDALIKVARANEVTIPRSPAEAILYCKDLVDGVCSQGENEDDDENSMTTMVKDIAKYMLSTGARIAESSEASFAEKYVMPAVRRVVLENTSDQVVYALIDKPDQDRKKPDIMIGTEHKKKDIFFFYVEVKRPLMQSRYQVEDDAVKLHKEMKDSVDGQLKLGIENPSSLGLLVEGYTCTLFRMTMLVDGVYTPMAIKKFSLVESVHSMINLPSMVETFSFVKAELLRFIEEVENKRSSEQKKMMRERICPSFTSGFSK